MEFYLSLVGIVLGIWLQITIARKFDGIAKQKGYDDSIHSFAMCFWLGLIGYLYVIALPDLTIPRSPIEKESKETLTQTTQDEVVRNQVYQCPKCGTNILHGTLECSVCHQIFDWKK